MSDTFDTFLRVLNEAAKADPEAIRQLIDMRILCNETLANHPTIQVAANLTESADLKVGLLGVLNGVCEATTGRRIAASYAQDGKLIGFIAYDNSEGSLS